ncbi:hypothetical protein [Halothiobacillus sp. DCM-1]|uniref:hypothetical protein n=1 Tax=Halothiobacillus sp. DCM-1 TaxID=3112558 RepID=UPI0032486F54
MLMRSLPVLPLMLGLAAPVWADAGLQPFIEGTTLDNTLAQADKTTQAALTKAGFEVVGHYAPVKNVVVLSITNPAMLQNAVATPRGGYGAALSISLEESGGKTLVSYVNPAYVAAGYRLASDNSAVTQSLAKVLGAVKPFGAKPRTAEQLHDYQYAFGMETFNDPIDLGGFPSFSSADQKITSRLQAKTDGVGLVYKIKLPTKDEIVYGVDLGSSNADANGVKLVDSVDTGMPHRYAFLPYEVLLKDKEAEALNLRFRMALFFPDLPMMGGDASFFKLRNAPDAVKSVLRKALGGTVVTQSGSGDSGFGGM